MKTVKGGMIAMLLFLTVTSRADSQVSNKSVKKYRAMQNKIQQQLSFMDCLPSTLVSSVVGAFTGGLTRYLEKEFKIDQSKDFIIFLIIAWWLERKARLSVINELDNDFNESDTPHKKSFMDFASWASSWVAYCHI